MEKPRVRKAPYPCKQPRSVGDEALNVGTLDVPDPKVERPSLCVTCGVRPVLRVRIAVDNGHCSTRKRLGQGCEHPNKIGVRRHAPPGGSVSHENSKLLGGLAIDFALIATHS